MAVKSQTGNTHVMWLNLHQQMKQELHGDLLNESQLCFTPLMFLFLSDCNFPQFSSLLIGSICVEVVIQLEQQIPQRMSLDWDLVWDLAIIV